MHMKKSGDAHGPHDVEVHFHVEDPAIADGKSDLKVMAARGESILEIALENHIHIEHTCGGVCACSTCHVYVEAGEDSFPEPSDDELDRVEEAPGLQINSRLSCQCRIEGPGPIKITVPAWNRNAVKEVPH